MSSIKTYAKALGVVVSSITLLVITSSNISAQTTNLSNGGSINFSSLTGVNGMSVQIGDKLFSNFAFQYTDTDLNMGDDLPASALVLSSLSNQVGFGVTIQLPLVATGITIKDVILQFTATVLDPNQKISDVHLSFTGSATGLGVANVSENIATNGFGIGTIANLSVSRNSSGFIPPGGEDAAILPIAQSKIWIEKDIVVSGNPDAIPSSGFNSASITIINQTFSQTQVPEPSTIALVLGSLATLFFIRRRK